MKAPHFNRALKRLVEERVVLPGPKSGHGVTFRLNPSYGWKGSAKGHREAVREHLRLVATNGLVNDAEERKRLEEGGQQRLLD